MSRFACDFNRHPSRAIYSNKSETTWSVKRLWKKRLTEKEKKNLMNIYGEFYFTLSKLLESHRFNIIFDGHTMMNLKKRPEISFGIDSVPKFYQPIIRSMQYKLISMGYKSVKINDPYGGGYILKWISTLYPGIFICSMEINKSIYMTKDMKKVKKNNIKKISKDVCHIFDIQDDEVEKYRLHKN